MHIKICYITFMEAKIYKTNNGNEPFTEWLDSFDDNKIVHTINRKINDVVRGLKKPLKTIKNSDGMQEIRIDYGPGYRIYIGLVDKHTIVLLFGGDKRSQKKDIKLAKDYWDHEKTKEK